MSILKMSRAAQDLSKEAGLLGMAGSAARGVGKGLYKTFLGGKKRRMATGAAAITGGMAAHGFAQGTKADTGAPLNATGFTHGGRHYQ